MPHSVTLSAAKDLSRWASRCFAAAQHDKKGPSIGINPSSHNPTSGRPQGSHPLILTAPALTKTRNRQFPLRSLCKGGGGLERRGDPCGRPEVGRFPRSTLT